MHENQSIHEAIEYMIASYKIKVRRLEHLRIT
jgi:hypothetical protein